MRSPVQDKEDGVRNAMQRLISDMRISPEEVIHSLETLIEEAEERIEGIKQDLTRG